MSDYIEFNIRPGVPSQLGYKVLDGLQYRVWIRWNGTTEKWYIDLTQISDATISICGRALLPGKDLLAPNGYAHLLGELWVEDTAGTTDNPTYEGMGDRWRLRYYPRTA
jgi:hypothetical protein